MSELRYYISPVTIEKRDNDEDSRTIKGYGIVFNELSVNLGFFREKIGPNAMEGVDLSDVISTFNHDFNKLMGRTSSKTLTLKIDKKGVQYRFEAPKTTAGNDLLESVRRGDIKGSSFIFTTGSDEWEKDKDGNQIRTVTKFKEVIEMGPVVSPAYLQTDVTEAKRSFDAYKEQNENTPNGGAANHVPLSVRQKELELKVKCKI